VAHPTPYYPVSLDLEGCHVLVVGAGRVAARKVAGLIACGAVVTVVAPEVHGDLEELVGGAAPGTPGSVSVERRLYQGGEAGGYRLVVTATGLKEIDRAAAADAESAGVFVNSADDPENCSFILPAVHRDGAVSIAVSTGGAAPALASWLRSRIASDLGDDLGLLADLLAEARHRVHSEGRSTEAMDWLGLLDGPFPELVARGDVDAARELLERLTGP